MSPLQIVLMILIVIGVGIYGFFTIHKTIKIKKGTYKPKKKKEVEDDE